MLFLAIVNLHRFTIFQLFFKDCKRMTIFPDFIISKIKLVIDRLVDVGSLTSLHTVSVIPRIVVSLICSFLSALSEACIGSKRYPSGFVWYRFWGRLKGQVCDLQISLDSLLPTTNVLNMLTKTNTFWWFVRLLVTRSNAFHERARERDHAPQAQTFLFVMGGST